MEQIRIAQKSLEPSSPAVPTAAADKQRYDNNDDQKSGAVHIILLGVIRDPSRPAHAPARFSFKLRSRKKLS